MDQLVYKHAILLAVSRLESNKPLESTMIELAIDLLLATCPDEALQNVNNFNHASHTLDRRTNFIMLLKAVLDTLEEEI